MPGIKHGRIASFYQVVMKEKSPCCIQQRLVIFYSVILACTNFLYRQNGCRFRILQLYRVCSYLLQHSGYFF